jgi:plastocyanin
MNHLVFETDVRQIPVGERITFSNSSSRAMHVLVVGKDAQPKSQGGAPSFGGTSGHRSEVGDRWTTPPWTRPGTYWVTCTLHPSMNLEVVVGG